MVTPIIHKKRKGSAARRGHTAFVSTILPFFAFFYKSQFSQKVRGADRGGLTALPELCKKKRFFRLKSLTSGFYVFIIKPAQGGVAHEQVTPPCAFLLFRREAGRGKAGQTGVQEIQKKEGRSMDQLVRHQQTINDQLARYGVKFGLYKNGTFQERLFPFDPLPRVITAQEFGTLDKGLVQRVNALNLFLKDVYGDKKIIRDGIVPEDFVFAGSGYLPQCEGFVPPKGVYSHISGIDLVQAKDGSWFILEDNLRIPSGASYPLIARELCRRCSPETFSDNSIVDNRNYAQLLRQTMDAVNTGGINVVFTPGRYNAAYFEHSYLAEKTGAVLAECSDLYVENNRVYLKTVHGGEQVGAIYRRISDEYLDPLTFKPESLIGIPGVMDAYRAGNVALLNAPGNGVADDKGIYYFVPKMIKYYLGEEPILHNAPTYLPFYEQDRKYVLEHLETLVVKDVAEAGGYGVVFGRDMTKQQLEDFRNTIRNEPRRFIAQEVIDFLDLPIMEGGQKVPRKADLRAFVLSSGGDTKVWASGLTRFSRNPDSFVVNSSQGGGFKDTWVLSR